MTYLIVFQIGLLGDGNRQVETPTTISLDSTDSPPEPAASATTAPLPTEVVIIETEPVAETAVI